MVCEGESTQEPAPSDERVEAAADEIIHELPADNALSARDIHDAVVHTADIAEAAGVKPLDVLNKVADAAPALGAIAVDIRRTRIIRGAGHIGLLVARSVRAHRRSIRAQEEVMHRARLLR